MTLRARKGTCLIRHDSVATESGGIVIPEYLRSIGRPHGILLQAGTDDPIIRACLGLRVLVRTAVSFDYNGEHYLFANIDQILAVVDKHDSIRLIDPIERCAWCRSKGEGNMMLDHNGYCITCGKNKYGEHKDHRTLKVSDDEKEAFGGTATDILNKERPRGMTISFAGQGKRTSTEAGKPRQYIAPKRRPIEKPDVPKTDGKIISAASLKRRSPL